MPRLTSFADVDEALKSTDFVMAKHPHTYPFQGGTVAWIDGEDHKERRRVEAVLFRPEALVGYQDVLRTTVRANIAALMSADSTERMARADLLDLVRTSLVPMTARIVGLDGVVDRASAERLRELTDGMMKGMAAHFYVEGYENVMDEALDAKQSYLHEFYYPSKIRRENMIRDVSTGRLSHSDLPVDLLTVLLAHPSLGDPDGFTEREAIIFTTGSSVTVGQAACHSMRELSDWWLQHPEDMAFAQEPVLLMSAAAEALRLHPDAPGLMRKAARPVVLASGRQIGLGERVFLDIASANRDPDVFGPDADAFNPRRQLPERVRQYGVAFGAGRHICSGLQLAAGIGSSKGASRETVLEGALATFLAEVFAAGCELDRDHPPVINVETAKGGFRTFPVRFTSQ